jgi:PAS domain S-box-containing protein
MDVLTHLFDTSDFPPRWQCGQWSPVHGWVHIVSDLAIFGAYLAIPCVLVYFVLRRRDVPFTPIFWLFGLFIFSCGFGHLVEATLFWEPWYRFSGAVKVVTALASWGTVLALAPIVPRALALPGLAAASERLEKEIAERRLGEEARNRLAAIVESSDDAIYSKDLEGRITSWNRGAEKVYGYSAQEVMGKSPAFLYPDHPEEMAQTLRSIQKGVPISHYESVRTRKDGRRVIVSLTASPIHDEAGRLSGASVIARDITERKRLEERFHAALESAPTAMVMIDRTGKIVLVNMQTEALFGYERKELLGRPVEVLVPERYRPQHPDLRTGFFAAPQPRRMGAGRDLFGLRKDGSEFPVEIGLNPIETEEGLFVLSAIVDISARKEAENAIQRYTAELERSNRDLDQFAYSASHDLKAPLRAVDQLAQWVEEDSGPRLSDESRRDLELMRKRLARMQNLLEDLLAYSRAGRSRHQPETLNAADVVHEVVELLDLPADFKVAVSAMPTLTTSRAPLAQVFRNLIGNAVKHHDRESGTVTLSAAERGHFVEFVVQDDGPGIAPEYHHRIFQMFQTLKPRDQVEGSGMGLALVKKIVESQGGQVSVKSAPGNGSSFRFTWPRHQKPGDVPAPTAEQ